MKKLNWTNKKPTPTKECLWLTACKIQGEWNYSLFHIKKVEFEEQWYWGIFYEDEEFDDIKDFRAKWYCVLSVKN